MNINTDSELYGYTNPPSYYHHENSDKSLSSPISHSAQTESTSPPAYYHYENAKRSLSPPLSHSARKEKELGSKRFTVSTSPPQNNISLVPPIISRNMAPRKYGSSPTRRGTSPKNTKQVLNSNAQNYYPVARSSNAKILDATANSVTPMTNRSKSPVNQNPARKTREADINDDTTPSFRRELFGSRTLQTPVATKKLEYSLLRDPDAPSKKSPESVTIEPQLSLRELLEQIHANDKVSKDLFPQPLIRQEEKHINEPSIQEELRHVHQLIMRQVTPKTLSEYLLDRNEPLPLHQYRNGNVSLLYTALKKKESLATVIMEFLTDFTNEEESLKYAIAFDMQSIANTLSTKNIYYNFDTKDNALLTALTLKKYDVVSNILDQISKASVDNKKNYLSEVITKKYPYKQHYLSLVHYAILFDDEAMLAILVEHGANIYQSLNDKNTVNMIKDILPKSAKLYYLLD